jgi:hypothetical protein
LVFFIKIETISIIHARSFFMKRFLAAIFAILFALPVLAQHYPELMVAPKATDRLSIESGTERAWSTYLPLQVAGATTLMTGILINSDLKDNDSGIGPKVAMAVGAGWLAASIYMQTSYRPYSDALARARRMPYKSTQEQLAAERLAEEEIDAAARMARKIKWFSFVSNLGVNAIALSSAKADSIGQGMGYVSALASFLPVFFPMRYEQVSEDHRSYKKRIFGPVTLQNTILFDPATARVAPGVMAGMSF